MLVLLLKLLLLMMLPLHMRGGSANVNGAAQGSANRNGDATAQEDKGKRPMESSVKSTANRKVTTTVNGAAQGGQIP
ncbi:competence protein ComEA [Sesbania bispinosa]|nr:competence protein ComEA [Sesbania bispinosa]